MERSIILSSAMIVGTLFHCGMYAVSGIGHFEPKTFWHWCQSVRAKG